MLNLHPGLTGEHYPSIDQQCRRLAAERVIAQKESDIRDAIVFAGADPDNHADIARRGTFELVGSCETFVFDGKPMLRWASPDFHFTPGVITVHHPCRKLYIEIPASNNIEELKP